MPVKPRLRLLEVAEHRVAEDDVAVARPGCTTVEPGFGPGRAEVDQPLGSRTGSGRSSIWSKSEKIAALAPMPSASDRIATAVRAGVRNSVRSARRRLGMDAPGRCAMVDGFSRPGSCPAPRSGRGQGGWGGRGGVAEAVGELGGARAVEGAVRCWLMCGSVVGVCVVSQRLRRSCEVAAPVRRVGAGRASGPALVRTCSIAANSSAGRSGLATNPSMPTSTQRWRSSSLSLAVSAMIGVRRRPPSLARISAVAS